MCLRVCLQGTIKSWPTVVLIPPSVWWWPHPGTPPSVCGILEIPLSIQSTSSRDTQSESPQDLLFIGFIDSLWIYPYHKLHLFNLTTRWQCSVYRNCIVYTYSSPCFDSSSSSNWKFNSSSIPMSGFIFNVSFQISKTIPLALCLSRRSRLSWVSGG